MTSTCSATASPPFFRMPATVASAPASSTSATTTRPPSPAKSRAVACPIPDPAPVIRQTLAASLAMSGALGADQTRQSERQQNDGAVDSVDPCGADVGEGKDVRDQGEQDDSGQRADHPAAPTVQRHTAD